MRNHSKYILCLILLLSVCCFPGCGPQRPPLGKVEGTVKFDGEPIKFGTIIFAVAGQRDASGLIENGVIKDVTTFDKGDGVPVGEAKIAVIVIKEAPAAAPQPVDDTNTPGGASPMLGGGEFAVPVKYVNPETSGLTTSITKGTITKVDLELTK
ncbi:MAG: hypothetical protein FWE67_11405 [Planctomycetaceae bacterium]|nr:hypothetical protein [Planctomycetaceae bacterium]